MFDNFQGGASTWRGQVNSSDLQIKKNPEFSAYWWDEAQVDG